MDGLCDLYPIAGDKSAKQERKWHSANCELHFQKEMTALSPKAVLETLPESTQEFCFLQMGRNVFLVQRKAKEEHRAGCTGQTKYGSWINAAPRWDKELLSFSGVTYV